MVVVCAVARIAIACGLTPRGAVAIGLGFGFVAVLPLFPEHLNALGYLYSITSNPSLASMLALSMLVVFWVSGVSLLTGREVHFAAAVLLVAGALLYASELGLWHFSVYRIGFLPQWFGLGAALVVGLMLWFGAWRLAIALCVCWAFGLWLMAFPLSGQSTNLWDQCIDFGLFGWSLFYWLRRAVAALVG